MQIFFDLWIRNRVDRHICQATPTTTCSAFPLQSFYWLNRSLLLRLPVAFPVSGILPVPAYFHHSFDTPASVTFCHILFCSSTKVRNSSSLRTHGSHDLQRCTECSYTFPSWIYLYSAPVTQNIFL